MPKMNFNSVGEFYIKLGEFYHEAIQDASKNKRKLKGKRTSEPVKDLKKEESQTSKKDMKYFIISSFYGDGDMQTFYVDQDVFGETILFYVRSTSILVRRTYRIQPIQYFIYDDSYTELRDGHKKIGNIHVELFVEEFDDILILFSYLFETDLDNVKYDSISNKFTIGYKPNPIFVENDKTDSAVLSIRRSVFNLEDKEVEKSGLKDEEAIFLLRNSVYKKQEKEEQDVLSKYVRFPV